MPRQSSNRELWYSLFAVCFATLVYLVVVAWKGGIPRASEFYGHTIGVFGFILMLMTETLYSLRKRSRSARWGRMADWLDFHIFTGIVGPYLVLLHTSWKFNGLAGVTTLLTVVIVISGFVGRYIYTRIPRTADGMVLEDSLSAEALRHARRLMALWHTVHIPIGMALFTAAFVHMGAALYYATFLK
jgi:hypothetical protein